MTWPALGVGRRHEQPCRNDPSLGEESDELTEVGVDAVERVPAAGLVVEAREIDTIPSALARVSRLAIVDFEKAIDRTYSTDWLMPGAVNRVEALPRLSHAAVLAGAKFRIQILDAARPPA